MFSLMKSSRSHQKGSALLVMTFVILILMALSAAFLHLAVVHFREQESAEKSLQAFYNAEAGVAMAKYDLEQGGTGNLGTSAMPVDMASGSFYTATVDNGDDTYTITSTSTAPRLIRRVEAVVRKFKADLDVGAFTFMVDPDVDVTLNGSTGVPLEFNGTKCTISGQDHDLDGNLLGDQSTASWGAGMNPITLSGGGDPLEWEIDANDPDEQLVGVPQTNDDLTYKGAEIDLVVDYVQKCADRVVDLAEEGNVTLTAADNDAGDWGTVDDFKTIYVDATQGKHFKLSGTFSGYGILVIDVGENEDAAFHVTGTSQWTGLVIYKTAKGYDTSHMPEPVFLTGGGQGVHLVGGLTTKISGGDVELGGQDAAIRSTGNADIKFSSEAVARALAAMDSLEVVSYRVIY